MNEKTFTLRTILTVTTGRLLTEPKGDCNNGIGDLYEILNHMTGDSAFTHQLVRFSDECKPWLFRWFPELKIANACLDKLDKWIKIDKIGTAQKGVKMWLAELKMLDPKIQDTYQVSQIPMDGESI